MKVKLEVFEVHEEDMTAPDGDYYPDYVRMVRESDLAPLLRLWEAAATLLDSPGMDKYGPTKLRVDILRDAFAAVPVEPSTPVPTEEE